MSLQHQQRQTESRWDTYKRLENLPSDLLEPEAPRFALGTQYLWRKLLDVLADELVNDQCVELLERCWEKDRFTDDRAVTLQQLWMLMD